MIKTNGKEIIDIIFHSTLDIRIYKGKLNSSIIYHPRVKINGYVFNDIISYEINTGDYLDCVITINDKVYNITNITNNYGNKITIQNNRLIFNEEGEFEIPISYKTYNTTLLINVYNVTLNIN